MGSQLICYADNFTLMAVVPYIIGVRVAVAESLNRDMGKVSDLCDLLGSKYKTMIVSRSRTMHPQSPPLTIGGTVLEESDDLAIYIGNDILFQDDF